MNLTAAKIQQHIELIRAGANVFLIDTAQLKRRMADTYIDGEARATYAAPVSFACRLITRSGSESHNIAAQAREIEQATFTGLYRMQVPYDLEISEGDQVIYTDKVSGVTKTLDVLFAPAKHTYSAAVVIQLQEVK